MMRIVMRVTLAKLTVINTVDVICIPMEVYLAWKVCNRVAFMPGGVMVRRRMVDECLRFVRINHIPVFLFVVCLVTWVVDDVVVVWCVMNVVTHGVWIDHLLVVLFVVCLVAWVVDDMIVMG